MGEIADDHYDQILAGDRDEEDDEGSFFLGRPPVRCNRCGSRAVRWRQQGGQWVLFSLQPGVEHSCASAPDTDGFEVIT